MNSTSSPISACSMPMRIVLHLDPAENPEHAKRIWASHLARARWMTENGYRHLLRGGAPS
jgi:hypothetical protein